MVKESTAASPASAVDWMPPPPPLPTAVIVGASPVASVVVAAAEHAHEAITLATLAATTTRMATDGRCGEPRIGVDLVDHGCIRSAVLRRGGRVDAAAGVLAGVGDEVGLVRWWRVNVDLGSGAVAIDGLGVATGTDDRERDLIVRAHPPRRRRRRGSSCSFHHPSRRRC